MESDRKTKGDNRRGTSDRRDHPLRLSSHDKSVNVPGLGLDEWKIESAFQEWMRSFGFFPCFISLSLMQTTVSQVISKALPRGSAS